MKIKVGVMGSAGDTLAEGVAEGLREKAEALGRELAARGCVVLTGGTTGLPQLVGGAARRAGALHVGVSPAQAGVTQHGLRDELAPLVAALDEGRAEVRVEDVDAGALAERVQPQLFDGAREDLAESRHVPERRRVAPRRVNQPFRPDRPHTLCDEVPPRKSLSAGEL